MVAAGVAPEPSRDPGLGEGAARTGASPPYLGGGWFWKGPRTAVQQLSAGLGGRHLLDMVSAETRAHPAPWGGT